jgi:hypothetical protein
LGLDMVSISNSYFWPNLGIISLKCFHGLPFGSFIKNLTFSMFLSFLARMFHALLSRDREDGCATGQPQAVGSKACLNGTSQGSTLKDARLPARRAYSSERRTAISAVAASDS